MDKENKDTEGTSGRKRRSVVLCAILMGALCLGLVGMSAAGGIPEAMAQGNGFSGTEDMDSEGLSLAVEISSTDTEDTKTQEEDSDNGTEDESESGTEARYDYTDVIEVPDVEYPYYIKVNRQANCVTVYTLDEDGEYTVPIKAMVCSVGLNDRTPLGVYTTSDKYEWRSLYGGVYGQYAYRITGAILFHSVPYYTMNKDDLETEEYNKLGEAASQGCIRLSCADAKWLIDNCPSGTTVEIYDDEDPGPLGKPTAITIDPDSPYAGWDPTDPDPENPWNQTEDSTEVLSEDSTEEETALEEDSNAENDTSDANDSGTTDTDDGSDSDTGQSSDTRIFNTPRVQVIEDSIRLITGQEDDAAELIEENLIITCEDEYRISLSYGKLKEAFANHWYGTYTCTVCVSNVKDGSVATASVEVRYLPY